jgi:hypothetical protein
MPAPLPLGRVVATPRALEMLSSADTDPGELLERHRCGDWGELDEHDWQENERSLANGWRVLSSYRIGEEKVWIITVADRSATTILFPEEY